jgi:hypothetical protein
MNQRTKDNLIYLGVGVTIAAAFISYGFYTEKMTGRIHKIPGPILWMILSTPAIAAIILRSFWEYRRQRSMWVTLVLAIFINISVGWIVFSFQWSPPAIIWTGITGLWLSFLLIAAKKFLLQRGLGMSRDSHRSDSERH